MSEIRWVARSASGYMDSITEGNDTFTWNGMTWTSSKPVGYKPDDSRMFIVFQTAYVNSRGDTGNKTHKYSFNGWGTISSLTSDYYPIFNNATDANNYNQGLEYNINNLIAGTIPEPPIVYNWQSVPSVSGKNGILVAMSTISDMNDGEPVTTTDTTKFTLVEESNVGVITEDIDDSIKPGADAGGISGSGDNSADQTTGNAFGQGESGTNVSGGGSGLYGGYKGTSSKSGGAGSGCIGNSLLSNKKMVGYNVPTSSAEGTKTESVNDVSASAVSGKPKSGNGFARIKFLRIADISNMTEWTPDGAFGWQVTYDSATKENHITGQCNEFWEYYEFPLDVERNKNYTVSLQFKGTNYNYFALYDTLRVLDRWQDATQIRQQDGINYDYVIAESNTHFSNQSNYVDCSVTFNSGNRDKIWLYIGAGYVYTNTWMDLYFKNITVVKND